MMRPFSLRWLIPFVLVVLLLPACSDTADDSADTTLAPTTTTTTTTAAPTTTTNEPTTTAPTTTAATTSDEESLNMVVLGDSVVSYTPTLTDAYATYLEEAFGIPVYVRFHTTFGSSPSALLNKLRNNDSVRADLEEADVVLLEIPQGDVREPFMTAEGWAGRDPADCGGDDNKQCLRDYVEENQAAVEAILGELTAICDPSETLIRAIDVYQMDVADRKAAGTLNVTIPYMEEAQEAFEEIAATYGIPVAQVYDEFMGPDGADDPRDRGLLSDQRHPSEAGSLLIAEMLHDLGYDLAN
jgi:lysophospholipase L1-like esterase